MSGKISAATERALARVRAGETAYRAAKTEGINLSTIYRALRRIKPEVTPEGTPEGSILKTWGSY